MMSFWWLFFVPTLLYVAVCGISHLYPEHQPPRLPTPAELLAAHERRTVAAQIRKYQVIDQLQELS
ncbi:hypothetical protein DVS77_21485 [Mycolicibacterium moriokaense]|nr:hypothetical protein DVS77_21485 [Mycolicibacterium moriokaense]